MQETLELSKLKLFGCENSRLGGKKTEKRQLTNKEKNLKKDIHVAL